MQSDPKSRGQIYHPSDLDILLKKVDAHLSDAIPKWNLLRKQSESFIEEAIPLSDLSVNIQFPLENSKHKTEICIFHASADGDEHAVRKYIRAKEDINVTDLNNVTPLHCAIVGGHTQIAKLLIDAGCEVNAARDDGATALHLACNSGNADVVQMLCEKRCKLDQQLKDGETPLFVATYFGFLDIVKYLIRYGCDVDARTNRGWTSLHASAFKGHANIARELNAANCTKDPESLQGETPLLLAVAEGHTEVVDVLLTSECDVNFRTRKAISYLNTAASHGHLKIAKLLMEAGCDVNKSDEQGVAPIHIAVNEGNLQFVRLLTNARCNVNSERNGSSTPLHDAVMANRSDIVEELINSGANTNAKLPDGTTALHRAAYFGYLDVIHFLLNGKFHKSDDLSWFWTGQFIVGIALAEYLSEISGLPKSFWPLVHCAILFVIRKLRDHMGWKDMIRSFSDVAAATTEGMRPIHFAALGGHVEAVRILIEARSDVNAKSEIGFTPLHAASQNAHLKVIDLLIQSECDLHASLENGVTALHTAIVCGHIQIVRELVTRGCNINAKDTNGRAPLHLSIETDQADIVDLLIDKKCDVNIADNEGVTPLLIATFLQKMNIVKRLIAANCNINQGNINEVSPIHIAAEKGYNDVLEFLISSKCNLSVRTKQGDNALHLAVAFDHIKAAKILINARCDINAQQIDGMTPLHLAVTHGFLRMVRCLLKAGCDVQLENRFGQTPKNIAQANNREDIVKALKFRSLSLCTSTERKTATKCSSGTNARDSTLLEGNLQQQKTKMAPEEDLLLRFILAVDGEVSPATIATVWRAEGRGVSIEEAEKRLREFAEIKVLDEDTQRCVYKPPRSQAAGGPAISDDEETTARRLIASAYRHDAHPPAADRFFFRRIVRVHLDLQDIAAAAQRLCSLSFLATRLEIGHQGLLQEFDACVGQGGSTGISGYRSAVDTCLAAGGAPDTLLRVALLRNHDEEVFRDAERLVATRPESELLSFVDSPSTVDAATVPTSAEFEICPDLIPPRVAVTASDVRKEGDLAAIGCEDGTVCFYPFTEAEAPARTELSSLVLLLKFLRPSPLVCLAVTRSEVAILELGADPDGGLDFSFLHHRDLQSERSLTAREGVCGAAIASDRLWLLVKAAGAAKLNCFSVDAALGLRLLQTWSCAADFNGLHVTGCGATAVVSAYAVRPEVFRLDRDGSIRLSTPGKVFGFFPRTSNLLLHDGKQVLVVEGAGDPDLCPTFRAIAEIQHLAEPTTLLLDSCVLVLDGAQCRRLDLRSDDVSEFHLSREVRGSCRAFLREGRLFLYNIALLHDRHRILVYSAGAITSPAAVPCVRPVNSLSGRPASASDSGVRVLAVRWMESVRDFVALTRTDTQTRVQLLLCHHLLTEQDSGGPGGSPLAAVSDSRVAVAMENSAVITQLDVGRNRRTRRVRKFNLGCAAVTAICFSQPGAILTASVAVAGTFVVQRQEGSGWAEMLALPRYPLSLLVEDRLKAAVCETDGAEGRRLALWPAGQGKPALEESLTRQADPAFKASSDGALVAFTALSGALRIWSLSSRRTAFTIAADPSAGHHAFCFSGSSPAQLVRVSASGAGAVQVTVVRENGRGDLAEAHRLDLTCPNVGGPLSVVCGSKPDLVHLSHGGSSVTKIDLGARRSENVFDRRWTTLSGPLSLRETALDGAYLVMADPRGRAFVLQSVQCAAVP